MKKIIISFFLILSAALHGAMTWTDIKFSGSNNHVLSGATFTIDSGATFTIAGGGTLTGTQPTNANLTAISGLTTAANQINYWTGSGTSSTLSFTAFSQTLLPLTGQQTWLNAIAPTSPAQGDLLYFDGTNWSRLPRGTTGQLLTAGASSISWASSGINLTGLTYASVISLNPSAGNAFETTTVDATGNATINSTSAGTAGQVIRIIIINDATSGKTITFGTNFISTGTIIGTPSQPAVISFTSDGVNFYETSRTVLPTVSTLTYATTISLDPTVNANFKTTTVNATGNATINAASAGTAGQVIRVIIANDATSGKTITFGTNFKPTGTLVGTTSKTAVMSFISDGTNFYETSRATGE